MVNAVVVPFLPAWFGSVFFRTDAARQNRREGNTQVVYFSTFSYYYGLACECTEQLYKHAVVTLLPLLHVLKGGVMAKMTQT